jgi:acetyl esterase/lipase
VRYLPVLPIRNRWSRSLVRTLLRRRGSLRTLGVSRRAVQTEDARLWLYTPDDQRSDGALLWIHGGGLVVGSAAMDDETCARTAVSLGIIVASAEYRLAPESPFPAAPLDCWACWRWLQDNASSLRIAPERIVVGGQSAGGGLAAGLAQRIQDLDQFTAKAQWLFSPMLDNQTTRRRELDTLGHRVWNNRVNRFAWNAYLGEDGQSGASNYAAPAGRVNLAGLPPTWIGVGDIDLFYDENRQYHQRLINAGVKSTLMIVNGAPHGFETWAKSTKLARDYMSGARKWLAEALEVTL